MSLDDVMPETSIWFFACEGADAQREGKSRLANPYGAGTQPYALWAEGWDREAANCDVGHQINKSESDCMLNDTNALYALPIRPALVSGAVTENLLRSFGAGIRIMARHVIENTRTVIGSTPKAIVTPVIRDKRFRQHSRQQA